MASVLESRAYLRFEMHEFNRDVKKIDALEKSMRKHGWIDAYPAHVVRGNNGMLRIKAGHHRFEVAKKLGIGIKYVICDDSATIYELEDANHPWTLADYLASYVRHGREPYIAVKKYHESTGISIARAASMLMGESAGSGNYTASFKRGTYRLGDPTHAMIIADIVLHCKKCGLEFASGTLFVQALSKIAWAEGFDPAALKRKISAHLPIMKKQRNQQEYIVLLDTVYNFQSKNKIPLAFLAEKAARERSAI